MFRQLVFNLVLLLAPLAAIAQTGPSDCHPYPGAVAQDCLELIGNHLGDSGETTCDSRTGRAKLNLRNCSVVTKCAPGQTAVVNDDAVRRALTTIGKCALSDYGSISGYYIAEDGSKTCYLYPSSENSCT